MEQRWLDRGFGSPFRLGHPAGHPSPDLGVEAQIAKRRATPDRHAIDVIIETARARANGLAIVGRDPLTNRPSRRAPTRWGT